MGRARRYHLQSPCALGCVLAVSEQGENDLVWHSHISLCCVGIRRRSSRVPEPTMGGPESFSSSFLYSYRDLVSWVLSTSLPTLIYLFDQCGMPQFIILNCRTATAFPTESALALQTLICKTAFPSLSFPTCKGGNWACEGRTLQYSTQEPQVTVTEHQCLQCGESVKYTPSFEDVVEEKKVK